jgi:hypothetical protein
MQGGVLGDGNLSLHPIVQIDSNCEMH